MKIINKRIMAYILISVSTFLSIYFFREGLLNLTEQIELAMMVGFAAIASGISGVMMSLSSKRVANFEAIREYFQQGDTPKMIENRKNVYATESGEQELDHLSASEICAFFHFWGMMVRKGYLPIWIFKSSSGYSILKLHYLLESFIQDKKTSNQHYAEGFDWLVKKINKQYRYTYETVENQDESIPVLSDTL